MPSVLSHNSESINRRCAYLTSFKHTPEKILKMLPQNWLTYNNHNAKVSANRPHPNLQLNRNNYHKQTYARQNLRGLQKLYKLDTNLNYSYSTGTMNALRCVKMQLSNAQRISANYDYLQPLYGNCRKITQIFTIISDPFK